MKIALAQLNFHIGNFSYNTDKIIASISKAKEAKAELIIFSELAVCGYPPLDFLESAHFIDECKSYLNKIATACIDIAAIVGAPAINTDNRGKKLFNAAYFLSDGKIKQVVKKSLLPNYDVFDEYRYFEPNRNFELVEYKNQKIALTICEDIWDEQDETFTPLNHSNMYTVKPLQELMKLKPNLIINIAASPFSYQQNEIRNKVLERNATQYQLPLIYLNQVGAQTELVFDGASKVLNNKGETVLQLNHFIEDFNCIDTDKLSSTQPIKNNVKSKEENIYDAILLGISDYFKKQNFSKAILGLSGGIDSALTLVLACEALGKENVLAVLLPSGFSSEHSIKDALDLVNNVGCEHEIISIEDSFQSALKTLKPIFEGTNFGLAEENLQARIRGLILMAASNKHGYILLNTSNKSEMAVGYGTLYGDMCGGLSVIGDVYKTEVYDLCNYINRNKIIIPKNTIRKAPSAELRPNQKDSDSLPEYDILDKILYQYIENKKSFQQIIDLGFDEFTVKKIINLVNKNEYKRKQSPPVIRVSTKAFGTGRRMPIVANYRLE